MVACVKYERLYDENLNWIIISLALFMCFFYILLVFSLDLFGVVRIFFLAGIVMIYVGLRLWIQVRHRLAWIRIYSFSSEIFR